MYGYRLGYNLVQKGALLNPYAIIGSQGWSKLNLDITVTAMGNVIPNVTSDAIWATSQTIYDDAITGGATIYEATMAAAMLCEYSNDPLLGGVYGKLFNWWAASLLQLDIEMYNIANPSNTWGSHIPSQAEFVTLQTTLGGLSVAGGKMKEIGFEHWNSPNTGATNESKFGAIPGGYRYDTGSFALLNTANRMWTITSASATTSYIGYNSYNAVTFPIVTNSKIRGLSIRTIKDETFPIPLI